MARHTLQKMSPEDLFFEALREHGHDLTKGSLRLLLSGYVALLESQGKAFKRSVPHNQNR